MHATATLKANFVYELHGHTTHLVHELTRRQICEHSQILVYPMSCWCTGLESCCCQCTQVFAILSHHCSHFWR